MVALATLGAGAVGVGLRFVIQLILAHGAFPIGTLLINVLGSGLIGFVYSAGVLPMSVKTSIMVGLLGGFTTFSSFSLETLRLWERGQFGLGLANVVLNNGLSLLACWCGLSLGRNWLNQ